MSSTLIQLIRLLCKYIVDWNPGKCYHCNSTIEHKWGCGLVKSCRAILNNSTLEVPVPDVSDVSKKVLLGLYVVTLVVATLGNVSVLAIFMLNKQVRHVTNVFYVSLALSDLLVAFCTTPFSLQAIYRSSWQKEMLPFTCKVVPYVQNVTTTATVLTLCCICAERYLAIVYPLRARTVTAWQRLLGLAGGVWVLSLLTTIPHAVWHSYVVVPAFLVRPPPGGVHHSSSCCNHPAPDMNSYLKDLIPEGVDLDELPVTASVFREDGGFGVCLVLPEHRTAYVAYKWVYLAVLYAVPTLFMIVAYTRVGSQLWRRQRRRRCCVGVSPVRHLPQPDAISASTAVVPSEAETEGVGRKKMAVGASDGVETPEVVPEVVGRKKVATAGSVSGDLRTRVAWRVTLMLVTAMTLFLVSWLPHLLYEAIALTRHLPTTPTHLNIRYYLEWLSVSNSCHNPIVYTLLHERFRRILVGALTCHRRRHPDTVHPDRSQVSPASSRAASHAPSLRGTLEKCRSPPGETRDGTGRSSPASTVLDSSLGRKLWDSDIMTAPQRQHTVLAAVGKK